MRYAASKKIQDSRNLVGSSGLEPPTSRLSGVRSNHLSYEPIFFENEPQKLNNDKLCSEHRITTYISIRRVSLERR